MLSAVGSIACAVATFLSALVALYLGLRGNLSRMHIRGYFLERDGMPEVEGDHPNCFRFECVNTGNVPIYIASVCERAHFKRSLRGAICFISSLFKTRTLATPGSPSVDMKLHRYYVPYKLRGTVEVSPGKMVQIDIPFAKIQSVQRQRVDAGLFDLNKPLIFYVADMAGKRYRVSSGAMPVSFLEERTCHMIKKPLFS